MACVAGGELKEGCPRSPAMEVFQEAGDNQGYQIMQKVMYNKHSLGLLIFGIFSAVFLTWNEANLEIYGSRHSVVTRWHFQVSFEYCESTENVYSGLFLGSWPRAPETLLTA